MLLKKYYINTHKNILQNENKDIKFDKYDDSSLKLTAIIKKQINMIANSKERDKLSTSDEKHSLNYLIDNNNLIYYFLNNFINNIIILLCKNDTIKIFDNENDNNNDSHNYIYYIMTTLIYLDMFKYKKCFTDSDYEYLDLSLHNKKDNVSYSFGSINFNYYMTKCLFNYINKIKNINTFINTNNISYTDNYTDNYNKNSNINKILMNMRSIIIYRVFLLIMQNSLEYIKNDIYFYFANNYNYLADISYFAEKVKQNFGYSVKFYGKPYDDDFISTFTKNYTGAIKRILIFDTLIIFYKNNYINDMLKDIKHYYKYNDYNYYNNVFNSYIKNLSESSKTLFKKNLLKKNK